MLQKQSQRPCWMTYSQQTQQSTTITSTSTSTKALKDFPLLAAKPADQQQPSQGHATSAALVIRPIRSHINQYIADIHTRSFGGGAIEFWHQKEQSNIYSVLTLIAQDLLSPPSSQAFVERLFSVCGMLTVGRRNRMDKSGVFNLWSVDPWGSAVSFQGVRGQPQKDWRPVAF